MAVFALVWNLVLGVILVLGFPFPGWDGLGFTACPIVTVSAEMIQIILFVSIFVLWKGLHKECWPGWGWHHVTRERVIKYTKVFYLGMRQAFSAPFQGVYNVSLSSFLRLAMLLDVHPCCTSHCE